MQGKHEGRESKGKTNSEGISRMIKGTIGKTRRTVKEVKGKKQGRKLKSCSNEREKKKTTDENTLKSVFWLDLLKKKDSSFSELKPKRFATAKKLKKNTPVE